MYKKYAYIDCFNDELKLPFKNPLIKYLSPLKIKKKIEKKFPCVVEEIAFRGIEGYKIKIPIITSINYIEDEEHIKKVIEKFNAFIRTYPVDILVLAPSLQKYVPEFEMMVAKEEMLLLLYIDKIIQKILQLSSKGNKDFTYIIIDGNPLITEYVLDIICDNINYLTLVTDTPSRYEEKLQEIYLETGLTIEITNKSIHQQLAGDIIINCSKTYDKLFYCYSQQAYVIDFVSESDKIEAIQNKRKDLRILNKFTATFEGEMINNDMLAGLLLNENRILRNMYLYGYRNSMKETIGKLKNKYDIQIRMG
jgi:hypothetical protein